VLTLTTIGLWALYSYEVTILTFASLLTVTWAVLSFLMERFNVFIPWHAVLPPKYNDPSSTDYFAEVVGLLAGIRCDFTDTWEDLQSFHAMNEARFVAQITVVGIVVAYFGSFISGSTLLISSLYILLLLPGILANSVPQRAFVVVEPYVKVYLDKAITLKNVAVAKINERINAGKQPATLQQQVPTETEASAEHVKESYVDDGHHKHE